MKRSALVPLASFVALAPVFALGAAACGQVLGTDFGDVAAAPADAGRDATSPAADTGIGDATGDAPSEAAVGDAANPGDAEDATDSGQPVDAGSDAGDAGDAGDASDAADSAPPAFPASWSVIYGSARDVGVGPTDDDIWLLDSTIIATGPNEGNYPAFHWNAGTSSFQPSTTAGTAIDVTSAGPCVVMQDNTVWVSQAPGELTLLGGGVGTDLGSSASDVWVISAGSQSFHPGELKVFRWTGQFTPNPFVQEPNDYGLHVDVAPDSSAWIVLHAGGIFHATFSNDAGDYEPVSVPIDGAAIDVGVGADGSVYVLGQTDGGTELFEYSPSAGQFEPLVPIDGVRVSAGPSRIFVVLGDGRLVASP